MKKLLFQIEQIDYYFSKVESYLSKKDYNSRSSRNSNYGGKSGREGSLYSGSPRSTLSDRVDTFGDEDDKGVKNFDSENDPN